MGVSNPTETVQGILAMIDKTREKMQGTELGALPWRPVSEAAAVALADLVTPALERCEDVSEALIAVTAAAVWVAKREANLVADGATEH